MIKVNEESFTEFPVQVAEFKGHTLTIEISDGTPPHGSPPGHLEVWLRRPKDDNGKPGSYLIDQNICQFFKNFDGDEEITQTQTERNALRDELDQVKEAEILLRREVGKLNARIKHLEAEVARERADVIRELAEAQIASLEAKATGA